MNFRFGQAIANMKDGLKVRRQGWNGKGMYITLIKAGNAMFQGYDMQDCIGLKTANNVMQPGWVPSQSDMLSEDWEVVEDPIIFNDTAEEIETRLAAGNEPEEFQQKKIQVSSEYGQIGGNSSYIDADNDLGKMAVRIKGEVHSLYPSLAFKLTSEAKEKLTERLKSYGDLTQEQKDQVHEQTR